MSKLGDLINEMCPDLSADKAGLPAGRQVEWKKIEEICKKISSGGTPNTTNKTYYNGNIPWLRTQEVNFNEIWNTEVKITEEGLNNSSAKLIPENCVIVAMYGATVGKIGINKIPLTTNQACCNLEIDNCLANYKYIFYCLSNQYEYIKSLGQGSQTNINAQIVKTLEIPIPPLEIQNEIVRILDKFTEYGSLLEQELVLRKKQYEYYRDKLLTFGDDVEWKTLGEIATVDRGGKFQKSDFVKQGKPCIHYGQMYTHFRTYTNKTITFVSEEVFIKSKIAHPNDIVMAVTSENIEDVCKCVAWLGNEDIAVSGHTAIIRHKQNAKYLAYYFQSKSFYNDKIKLAHGTKVIEVTPSKMLDIKIPVPPLSEQERIVSILDRFETLCNDLTAGLPAEISARKKQYEYYRDKLLTFKRKDC